MITKDNFKDLLKFLDFQTDLTKQIFNKTIEKTTLQVDFTKNQIIYPEKEGLKVNERQTCNFSLNENFVVFECVHRLLEKGYQPKHLEIEPKWKLGHGAKGGRADILVKDQKEQPLLLIECKTAGNELTKAWNKTLEDGDQLFSYAQQISTTKFLCLYASDFINGKIRTEQRIISHQDNETILEENPKLLSYKNAEDVKNRFQVWKVTYKQEYTEKGIFEKSIQAYQIGKNKYTLEEDTKSVDSIDQQGKYHEFRTILRKHNIARRENAFEVLVNLFLCKIVDEDINPKDLNFYWKGIAYDNYFDFVDRLQNLYQIGMRKFLNEEISYISNEQIDGAFWAVKNDPNATKKQIKKYFRQLKFFTNSAFSLIDTYNEKLFLKNVKVLLELVQMWQGLQLRTEGQNQFLGDMFEYFLDNSIKQSNGQFFTPLPICKFMIASLPLEKKIIEQGKEPLNMIDYACGSGHFLNEYAYQIKPIVERHNTEKTPRKLEHYYKNITGIEKEDRLAKVSKVASFMYGQDEIKILDIDALSQHQEVKKESYDVLVANPPFAVEGFLKTLNDEDKEQFQLTEIAGKSSETNTIQCFFLERLHYLMQANGVVGVIVPSSILSNSDAIHIKTREILLQYFNLISIAELGSAFGKTGTNTVVLFLRRKPQRPEPAEQYFNRVNDFFNGDQEQEIYEDLYFVSKYCQHIQIDFDVYQTLFQCSKIESIEALLKQEIFQEYQKEFSNWTEIKNLKKQKTFKNQTQEEQQKTLHRKLIDYLQKQEKNKLYYFILACEQQVLIVNAPSNHKEQKDFLGYEWSNRKGDEGIKYNGGENVNEIITPLFNPKNFDDESKINTAIKKHFNDETIDPLPPYCRYARLSDMLDFSKTTFDKTMNLNPKINHEIESQWEMVKLENILENLESGNRPKGGVGNISEGALSLGGEHINSNNGLINLTSPKFVPLDFYQNSNRGKLKENDILICKDGALTGKIALLRKELQNKKAMINEHVFILRCNNLATQKYLFNFLFSKQGQSSLKANITGSAQGGLNSTNLKNIKIPLPPLEIQQKIVKECEAIDQEVEQAQEQIKSCKSEIEKEVKAVVNGGYEMKNLGEISKINAGQSPKGEYYNENKEGLPFYQGKKDFGIKFLKKNNIYTSSITKESFKGDILFSVRAPVGDVNINPFEKICIGRGLAAIQANENFIFQSFLFFFINQKKDLFKGKQGLAFEAITISDLKNIKIPLPPLTIQKELVQKVEGLEEKINQAQSVVDGAKGRKEAVLKREL